MPILAGTQTEKNLKAALARCSQANRRYLYFAQKANLDGYNDISAVFRSTAEGETNYAFRLLQFLEEIRDPTAGKAIGATPANLHSAITETHGTMEMYPGMARTAREEGFDEIADWFEVLARAHKVSAQRFQKALGTLE